VYTAPDAGHVVSTFNFTFCNIIVNPHTDDTRRN